MPDSRNALYYGDCLHVLRQHVSAESVDLVYLDPPFNSNRDYNVLFKEQTGAPAEAQVKAFTDTWKWTADLNAEWDDFVDTCPNQPLVSLMQSFVKYLKRNDVTAYLARMTPRLFELHRVLKPTGSLYLHCDPAASHYLKIIADMIFGPANYRNEISWLRSNPHGNTTKSYGRIRDVLLYYVKSESTTWNKPHRSYFLANGQLDPAIEAQVHAQYTQIEPGTGRRWQATSLLNPNKDRPNLTYEFHGHTKVWRWTKERMEKAERDGKLYFPKDGDGVPREKRYLDEQEGYPEQDLWADIKQAGSNERLGYPTQKPVALLKRILEASSNAGDVVLDPFCGCGTTVMAAQELGRRWIGIDITATATSLIEARLFDAFGIHNGRKGDYDIIGLPTTEAEAIELASRDKHEFQKWAISLVPRAMPWQEKKGADGGVDGFVRFKFNSTTKGTELVIISVKGGQTLKMDDIKNLEATMKANDAKLGFLISLVPPTKGIVDWAQQVGVVKSPEGGTPVPAIQCRTVAQLLRGESFAFPWNSTIHGIPKAGEGQRRLDY